MPVFRGLGGAGSSDDDATISAVTAQAQIATTKANEASASANSAASSSATAVTKADEASTSATNAANSASAASSSASTASTAATAAGNAQTAAETAQTAAELAETNAETAETNAETAETNAAASASAASTSETNAANSASTASTAATNASNSATAAQTAQTNAETAQTAAEAAQAAAEAAQEAIDGFFLGVKTANPTLDNNGNAVTAGDWYFNSVDNSTRIYDGSNWNTINPDLVGDLTPQLGGNLDLNGNDITGTGNVNITGNISLTGTVDGRDVAADGTKLDGVETGATADQTAEEILTAVKTVDGTGSGLDADLLDGNEASAFATSAQGSLADSATQPGDNVSTLTNDSGYLTGNQTITLSGDVSGSGTTAITVTIADDSHNHIISNVDGLQTALDGKLETSGGSVTGDMTFGDNNKAIFGAGSDLQIYHDGMHSYVSDQGTGNIKFLADDFIVKNSADTDTMIQAFTDGAVTLWYDNAQKLATTNTGIDVTGTITADGLDVDGTNQIQFNAGKTAYVTGSPSPFIYRTGTQSGSEPFNAFGNLVIQARSNAALGVYVVTGITPANRLKIADSGDISFYEDTGTTPKFFWDASEERLGIGTTSPGATLSVDGSAIFNESGADVDFRVESDTNTHALFVEGSSGNVGIGTASPSSDGLEVANKANTIAGVTELFVTGNASGKSVLALGDGPNKYVQHIISDHTNNSLQFNTASPTLGGNEAMRLDSSGNLLVGKTASGTNDTIEGLELQNDGQVFATKSSAPELFLTRLGSDGEIANFYKGSTKVGSIGNSGTLTYLDGTGGLIFKEGGSEAMRIDASGNLLVGGTGTPTSSVGNFVLYNGTAPTGNATNGVILYAEDVSASSELKVRDEAGNVTTLSPHNFDLIPEGPSEDMAWSYYSERDGKRINVDMLKAIRLLEQLTGEKLVHTS